MDRARGCFGKLRQLRRSDLSWRPAAGNLASIMRIALLMGIVGGLLLCLSATGATGERAPRAYEVAVRFFQEGTYDLAEQEFADFVRIHPGSDKVPEAVLFQAQAMFQQERYADTLTLLRARLDQAGPFADRYQFWMAEALFQQRDFAAAAQAYAAVLAGYPDSPRRLEASLGEAYAAFELGDRRQAADLLRAPEGSFQRSAELHADSELVARGQLLLAEACLDLGDYLGGIDALSKLSEQRLPPELTLQRQYVLARLQMGAKQTRAALTTATNLLGRLTTLTNVAAVQLKADAVSLQGALLERNQQPEAAIQAYELNLGPSTSAPRRLEAVQQIVRLTLALNRVDEAVARLEDFVRLHPAEPAVDLMRLTLGELRLRQYYTLAPDARRTGTNLLQQARLQFSAVITNTNSVQLPRAHLNRGWVRWEAGQLLGQPAQILESLADFHQAAATLPVSEEQAIARFKLGDGYFVTTNYTAAITNYWLVATNYPQITAVQDDLVDHALHQVVRAGIELGDLETAQAGLAAILEGHPQSRFGDRSLLLFGQAIGQAGQPQTARELFAKFNERFPESPLIPAVKLAMARAHQLEGDWPGAVALYDQWVTNHVDHPSLPQAKFDRAWGHAMVGSEADALRLFKEFLARYPDHGLSPWAQHWVADHHFRLEQFDQADLNYQQIFQNPKWAQSQLAYHARLMAGRSAFFRQGYNDARGYFTNLIADASCPPALLPEVYFELGNTIMEQEPAATEPPMSRYSEAIVAYNKIPQLFPESSFAPLAWGQIGNCHLQLATVDPKQFDRAIEAYKQVLGSPRAEVIARGNAEFGIAAVHEKRAATVTGAEQTALLNEALRGYLYVVEGRHLRENEAADPALVKESALAAARIAEEQRRWDVAETLYRRLMDLLPPTRGLCEARLQRLARIRASAP
jgi:TolA-binding protein